MTERITDHGNGFHAIRGEFRVLGLLNVATQCSLVRMSDGDFVFLDSYTLPPDIRSEVDRLTDNGRKVRAIINLHPFHTVHCKWMHEAFPQAKLYGLHRHTQQWPDLPWEDTYCDAEDFEAVFGGEFAFSVPEGTRLVCEDETVHFASVLAFHHASRTIHVDDTLSRFDMPFPLSIMPLSGRVDFHPTLGKALEKRAGAANAFREWAIALGIDWADARRIVMAHNSSIEIGEGDFPDIIGAALGRVADTLEKHRQTYG